MTQVEPHISFSNGVESQAETSVAHWFALKTFRKGVFNAETKLAELGIETYLPCERVRVERADGTLHYRRRPLINSLLFFRATYEQAADVKKCLQGEAMIYTRRMGYQILPYAIPDREMNIFMLVTSAGDQGMELMDARYDFHQGEHVRVVDGPFKGAEGYICRIKKNRRLVVSLEGVCAVATSYIPREFLQRM